ncbi:hypothetical protein VNO77_46368 [Canavalia gladiata]|uniref:Uncharacterized protein n=1 Tax=Canavalia gladiata TaxID=3824 RepID=A0AAN9JK66_CANGL
MLSGTCNCDLFARTKGSFCGNLHEQSSFFDGFSALKQLHGIEEIMAERIRICSPRNYPKLDLGLFEIVLFNRNQRCFLVSRFFSEQIEEPNGSGLVSGFDEG